MDSDQPSGVLSTYDLAILKFYLLKKAQRRIQEEQIRSLDMSQENIYRCGGRVMISHFPDNSVHPKCLPKNGTKTLLIILDPNNRLANAGTARTVFALCK
ncbi:hypothetical protein AB6A40_011252 [Gnathostoma spinigerum]|uniref:Uncharacterized protein n=1 Tax=Gnathostoma spinigerum TaxID=75299 RepID=A0ABD6EXP3_9BILA